MRIFGPSRIAIIGAGEFGKQAAHYILQNDRNSRHHEIVGWYDDTISKGEIIAGYPVLGKIDSATDDFNSGKFEHLFIAIGYNHPDFKESLINKHKGKIPLYNIISPEAYIDPTSVIEENIFIYPGYKFKTVKGLITNFHLPESTLIMLVSAFAGRDETLGMYNTAVKEGYRFFSFGDSTLLI